MLLSENSLNLLLMAFIFAIGACIGSFLNVVAYRLPLEKSVIAPRSACPHCGIHIPAWGLLPVIGYFLVKGRCVHCQHKISIRYPIVELITGILTVVIVSRYVVPVDTFYRLTGLQNPNGMLPGRFRFAIYIPIYTALWLLYTGVPLTLIDLDHRILPDVITLPGTVIGFLIGCANPALGWSGSLLGIALGAGTLFVVAKGYEILRNRDGLGYGDIKYLALVGAVLGWKGVVWTIAISSIVGAVIGIAYGLARGEGLKAAIPFGPFIAIAALISQLWGPAIQNILFGMGG